MNKYRIEGVCLLLPVIVIQICFTGCKTFLGIKNSKCLDDNQIAKAALKIGIPDSQSLYKIDVDKFKDKFFSQNNKGTKWLNDIMQPLQIKAFDKKGDMALFLVNCHVGGSGIHLTWNREGSFDTFIPSQGLIQMPDSLRILVENISLFTRVKGKGFNKDILAKNDLIFFVFWSRFMGRYSKELVEQILSYKSKYDDKDIEVFYINMDNLLCQ